MKEYDIVIGLEVHCQLKTNTKIWCNADANYDAKDPNTCISPVSTGMPGALPRLNEEVLNYAIKAALALNCDINRVSYFDRKNYFYPDSPKNYQITQYFKPYAENGYLEFIRNDKEVRVEIERIQIEEDTAKSIHTKHESILNFNRASIPLIEIITKPCITNPQDAYVYLNTLKERLKYTGVSDVSMELGSLRCDANVSIKEKGSDKLGTRTETKNLNSFKAVVRAIEYEANRQMELIEKGERVVQETRLWDDEKGITRPMRNKEEAMDYRYFPEPDLPRVLILDDRIEKLKSEMPEFADEKQSRFMNIYGLSEVDAGNLVTSIELANYFENVVKLTNEPKLSSNWMLTEVLRVLKEEYIDINEFKVSSENLAKLIKLVKEGTISSKIAKDIFEIMCEDNKDPNTIVKEKGLIQISDTSEIEKIVKQVIEENPESVNDYLNGKDRAIKALMGSAMKISRGKANPQLVQELLIKNMSKE
ncbi:Asp-tRNA(Asn)/Glu-tRNA(Gln) amidotransferase subunit GatB [Pseudostreptobacillus hongkongensis]|uniref:Asp-tRNA(Asn)/Glu-tRNA(Gln) amidotransferase subunit GatB n=1 Tax=Pseudostreptobacillus hongkongensis TaxID=1162717 RepID=UPI0028D7544E|nr:Asp-tRNA(Asn)/Glu-tRNA(Gln) amidotransferase subunit GatB [Pseudostreptobacillus hongkongensis]